MLSAGPSVALTAGICALESSPRKIRSMSNSRRHLTGFADVLKQADALQRGMPVAYLLTFVLVALDEGKGVIEYANRAGVDRFSMSRYLALLGDGQGENGQGYGWVTHKRVGKGKSITLTSKGHVVLSHISQALSDR